MPKDAESIRARIQAVNLVDRLQDHAFGLGTPMNPSQIHAASILLKKVAPDLKSIDVQAPANNRPLITIVNYTELEELPETLQIEAGPTIEELLE